MTSETEFDFEGSDTSQDGYNYYEDMFDARSEKKFGVEVWDARSHGFAYPTDSVYETLNILRDSATAHLQEHPEDRTEEVTDAIEDACRMTLSYARRFQPLHYTENKSNKKEVLAEVDKFSEIFLKFIDKQMQLYFFLEKSTPYVDGG